tara:strand:- start:124 stop:912 length:789 start_codon:yes stop_codon:yes gene_type:complete
MAFKSSKGRDTGKELDVFRSTSSGQGIGGAVASVTEDLYSDPLDGSTGVKLGKDIIICFNQTVTKGSGNIKLRDGSASGTVLKTIAVSSGAVTIVGGKVTINPSGAMDSNKDTYVVVDAGAFVGEDGTSSPAITTYNFTTETVNLGDAYQGGYLICNQSTILWVVAPASTQLQTTWANRGTAVDNAQAQAACGDWFVPTISQMQNPGYTCRTYWDSYDSAMYWSNTEHNSGGAWRISMSDGTTNANAKTDSYRVRAFRCVAY